MNPSIAYSSPPPAGASLAAKQASRRLANTCRDVHGSHAMKPIRLASALVCAALCAAAALPALATDASAANPRIEALELRMRQRLLQSADDLDARYQLARALLWQKRYIEAGEEFHRLIKLRPDDVDYLLGLAQIRLERNTPQRALPLIQKARKIAPQFQDAWRAEIQALLALDTRDSRSQAQQLREEAHKLFPDSKWLFARLDAGPGAPVKAETSASEDDAAGKPGSDEAEMPQPSAAAKLPAEGEAARPGAAVAAAAPAVPGTPGKHEAMILSLRVNQVQRGEIPVFRSPTGDFLISSSDVTALGIRPDARVAASRIEGESGSFVSLRSLGARKLDLDIRRLALDVELPPTLFGTTERDLSKPRRKGEIAPAKQSAFVNYRLSTTDSGANATMAKALATEVGVRFGDILLRNEAQASTGMRPQRFATQIIYDRVDLQQRYIAGDHLASSGELGSSVPMAGLNLSKVYQMEPNLVRQPLAGFAGMATTPSRVEVRVGGAPVATTQVGPGPFELQNLRQFGGGSNVEVVVRDALGREQSYTFPFYFSDQSLRAGLQEYSYSLGKLRLNAGTDQDRYGPAAFSAFHRFGYSDTLTLGARAEAAKGLVNVGGEAVVRDDQMGVFATALSGGENNGHRGIAALFSYAYQQRKFGVRTIARHYGPGYLPLEDMVSPFRRRADYGASASWYLAAGSSIAVDRTISDMRDQVANQATRLIYSHSMGKSGSLFVTLQHVANQSGRGNEIFVGINIGLDGKHSASVNSNRDHRGAVNVNTQIAHPVPMGEGLGYRVGLNNTRPPGSSQLSSNVQWNGSAASVTLDTTDARSQDSRSQRREAAVFGAVAYADGAWGFARQINDSFAIVRIGDGLEGVRVQANSMELGRSNASGQFIVPNVGAFGESRIGIDGRDIPLEYSMKREAWFITPSYRSGVLVDFGIRRVHAVEGIVKVRSGDTLSVAENQIINLRKGDSSIQLSTGRGGHFYSEELEAGKYRGEIQLPKGSCQFSLSVPESKEVVYSLPEAAICE